jgi:hypothetical protein
MKNELTNLDIGLLVNTPAVPLTVDGETLPVPMYVLPGEDGRAHLYTVNRENILHSNNGGQTFEVVASATGSDLAKTKLFSEGNKVESNKVNELIEKKTVGNATPESMGLMPKAEIPESMQMKGAPSKFDGYNKQAQVIEPAPAKDTQLTAEGNAENKKAGNSFSRTEYEFIRTSILPWMISNPGKTPKKADIPVLKDMDTLSDEDFKDIFNQIKKEMNG